jgi:hypothetical protein
LERALPGCLSVCLIEPQRLKNNHIKSKANMNREQYRIFSPGTIAGLTIPNRLVRSTNWDPSILLFRQATGEVLYLYRSLALGGVGMIITGGLPVYRERLPEEDSDLPVRLYPDLLWQPSQTCDPALFGLFRSFFQSRKAICALVNLLPSLLSVRRRE